MIISPECALTTVKCAGHGCRHVRGESDPPGSAWRAVGLVPFGERNGFVSIAWEQLDRFEDHPMLVDVVILAVCGSECARALYEKYLATGHL